MGRRATVIVLLLVAAAAVAAACGGDDDNGGDPTAPTTGELRQAVHWHADFALYINGEQFDFNTPDFVSTEDEELNENVHIHEPRYTVVHAHREQSTWNEFFTSLGMKVTDTCVTLKDGTEYCEDGQNHLDFLVNDVPVDGIRDLDISDLQRVLIWYGPETADQMVGRFNDLVSNEACIPSERCAERVPENPEPEPCTISNDTCN